MVPHTHIGGYGQSYYKLFGVFSINSLYERPKPRASIIDNYRLENVFSDYLSRNCFLNLRGQFFLAFTSNFRNLKFPNLKFHHSLCNDLA